MSKTTFTISLPLSTEKRPQDCTIAELSVALNSEVEEFNRHVSSLNQDTLVKSEVALLKTYLAWKILHAPVGSSSKD